MAPKGGRRGGGETAGVGGGVRGLGERRGSTRRRPTSVQWAAVRAGQGSHGGLLGTGAG